MHPTDDTLHDELITLVKDLKNCELKLACKLAEMKTTGGFKRYASSMTAYMSERLNVDDTEKPRKLLKIGLALLRLPLLKSVMEDHSLGWTKAFEVSRVATPETEAGWVARAQEWPVGTLRAAVQEAQPGDDAPDAPARPDTAVIRIELTVAQQQRFRKAAGLARSSSPEDGPDLSDADVLELMVECFTAQTAKEEREVTPARFKTVIRKCVSCETSELAGLSQNHHVAVDEIEHAMACCDGQFIDLSPGQTGRAHMTVTNRLRRQLFERADYGCETPGCNHWLHLDVHHIWAREHGGPHSYTNCVVICDACHRRAHEGHLLIETAGRGSVSFAWATQFREPGSVPIVAGPLAPDRPKAKDGRCRASNRTRP